MKVSEASARVDQIWEQAETDDVAAHAAEDLLRKDVLHAIANLEGDGEWRPDELAHVALATESISFSRWCA